MLQNKVTIVSRVQLILVVITTMDPSEWVYSSGLDSLNIIVVYPSIHFIDVCAYLISNTSLVQDK